MTKELGRVVCPLCGVPVNKETSAAAVARIRKNDLRCGLVARLPPQQKKVLELLARGESSKAIGAALKISMRTVEAHRSSLKQRLGVRSTAEALRIAFAANLGE